MINRCVTSKSRLRDVHLPRYLLQCVFGIQGKYSEEHDRHQVTKGLVLLLVHEYHIFRSVSLSYLRSYPRGAPGPLRSGAIHHRTSHLVLLCRQTGIAPRTGVLDI